MVAILEIRDGAADADHRTLQARAERALSRLFRRVGDPSAALEHAVAVLALDGDDLDLALRSGVRPAMADAPSESGAFDDARPGYREALELARSLSTPWSALLVLNNWTCTELEAGDLVVAGDLVEQVQALAAEHSAPLVPGYAGTVAEVLHARGRTHEAITMLRQRCQDDRPLTSFYVAGCWLTLAQIERDTGNLDAAEKSLVVADGLAIAHELHGLRVEAIGSRAELLAARGDHAGAHETHLRFHAETLALRSAASDARAQTLHATLTVDQARRESARHRQMSYRDPLTQLLNRRHVDEDLDHQLPRGGALAVAMVDLDHFKAVNDTCSHEAGDAALVHLAGLLTGAAAETPGASPPTTGPTSPPVPPSPPAPASRPSAEQASCTTRTTTSTPPRTMAATVSNPPPAPETLKALPVRDDALHDGLQHGRAMMEAQLVDQAQTDTLIDDLEASQEGRGDAAQAIRDLLGRLPETPATEVQRARLTLLTIDEVVRARSAADAALAIQGVRDVAVRNGHRALEARAERALSVLFREIGDPSASLERAVAALALDGDDLDPTLRCRLPPAMADALTESGSFDDARGRYREALERSASLGAPWVSLHALNNWAYAELLAGDPGAAADLTDQLRAMVEQHGTPRRSARAVTSTSPGRAWTSLSAS